MKDVCSIVTHTPAQLRWLMESLCRMLTGGCIVVTSINVTPPAFLLFPSGLAIGLAFHNCPLPHYRRWPWLDALSEKAVSLLSRPDAGIVVMSCSMLKQK